MKMTRVTWFDTAGVITGIGLIVAYVSIDSTRADMLLYAGLVALAAHAYLSIEVLPKRRRQQAAADDIVLAYREVLKQLVPSGAEIQNGQHPKDRPGQPVYTRTA